MTLDSQEKLLIARGEDAISLAEKRCFVKTLGFLNPYEQQILKRHLPKISGMEIFFDGGYPEAERTMLVCYPDFLTPETSDYITVLECTGRDLEDLSHRDYLGSLMGLGITRENIGDILVSEDRAYLFVKPEITEYILQNLSKIGRRGVTVKEVSHSEAILPVREAKEVQGTVAGLRLDAVIATAISVARGKSADLIRGGLVDVNWETVEDVSREVKEGDVFSVRGYGRMKLSRIGGLTRKGRYGITVLRYL